MKYNPRIHHRRSIRLQGYDYSQAGLYFVTICCQDRVCHFGNIDVGVGFTPAQMVLNEFGQIAYNEWVKLPQRFPNFELDVFQIMPNHMHGIIMLKEMPVGAGFTPAHEVTINQKHAIFQNESDTQNVTFNNNDGNVGAGFTPAHRDEIAQNDLVGKNDVFGDIGSKAFANMTGANGSTRDLVGAIGDGAFGNGAIGAGASPAPTGVPNIVGAYKSLVANRCLEMWKSKWAMVNPAAGAIGAGAIGAGASLRAGASPAPTMGKIWQRNYYEHIIRNEQSYQTISDYIINNPAKWKDDKFYMP